MPVAKAIALSNAIHHRANKNREHEAARWVWQHRQGVALSYPAAHDDGMEVTLIKNPKDEAAIRAVAREVNADGRHRDNERPTDLSDALTKTDHMGQYLGRLSVLAFCYWAIVQKATPVEVRPFFDEMAIGPCSGPTTQARVTANALFSGREHRDPNDQAEIILRGWIDYRTGVVKKRKPTGKLPTLDELAVAPLAAAA
jgi:hypothetical protein